MAMTPEAALSHVRFSLLFKRRWAYLRYLHAREAMRLVDPASSVLVVGGGFALAEVALAVEFPAMTFHVTDHEGALHNLDAARKLIAAFGLTNITFGSRNILSPAEGAAYDVVYSVEVLEHIKEDEQAAANMCALARRFVFCLVPFAEDAANADEALRAEQLATLEHQVIGYDAKRLARLFPNPVTLRGAYWNDGGRRLRNRLAELEVDAMRAAAPALEAMATDDLRPMLPVDRQEAVGIWTLARVHG